MRAGKKGHFIGGLLLEKLPSVVPFVVTATRIIKTQGQINRCEGKHR